MSAQLIVSFIDTYVTLGSSPSNSQMTHIDTGQSAPTDPNPAHTNHLIRAIANRLRQSETYRRGRLIRYARLRTRIKGPSAVNTFHAKQATGTQTCCNSCQYFADVPQMVCALHPDGPISSACSDCIPHADTHI
ncbi:MAG: hypothetical protein AAF268_02205 [Cyanobacteria bacterium P01_A01_bin.3]